MACKKNNPVTLRHEAEDASVVLPALIAAAERTANAILSGEHPRKKPGAGEQFWQYRDYVPSDRPQDIDWKQSAKSDHVFIRQKEWQTAQTLHFWIHDGPGMNFASSKTLVTKAERAKTLLLALAILTTRAGEKITFLDRSIRPGRTEHTLQKLAAHLCLPPHSKSNAGPIPETDAISLPQNSAAILIGDFLSDPDALYAAFKTLSGRCTVSFVLQILDPAEIDLPYSGRVLFEDPLHQAQTLIDHTGSVRQAYQERITRHIEQIRNICHSLHWGYALHTTDQDMTDTLSDIWAQMAPQNYKSTGGF